ncbi:hypothetical protein B0H10DRAFT_1038766 [Mycena sp. CBHHK59/15]|nr:hypothetical protein B0H10DRAFT_1038766 [Mycena sp. CBHHK59/15]
MVLIRSSHYIHSLAALKTLHQDFWIARNTTSPLKARSPFPMSSSYPEKPVSMLIPDFVALNSETNPSGPFYIYAKPDPSNDIVTISNFEFNRATRRAAQILRPNRRGLDGEVVALIALSDTVLYQAIVVGLINANLILRIIQISTSVLKKSPFSLRSTQIWVLNSGLRFRTIRVHSPPIVR